MRFGERSGTFVAKDGASPPHQQNCSRATITSAGTEPPGAAELDSRLAPDRISPDIVVNTASRPAGPEMRPTSLEPPTTGSTSRVLAELPALASRSYICPNPSHAEATTPQPHSYLKRGPPSPNCSSISPHAPFSRFSSNITYQMDPQTNFPISWITPCPPLFFFLFYQHDAGPASRRRWVAFVRWKRINGALTVHVTKGRPRVDSSQKVRREPMEY